MNSNDWSEFWWNNVTGAHLVIANIVDALTENKIVIIDIPVDLPWRHKMRSAAEDEFRKLSGLSDTIIEIIDATDDISIDMSPGNFLLDRFAPNKEVRNGYRERSQRSIQEYIIENDVLKNRIVWVKGISNIQVANWVSFCRDYYSENVENGLFVLEIHGGVNKQDCTNLYSIRLLDFISNSDVQLFCSFIVEEKSSISNEWKRYLSTAAAIICDFDAEIASQLLEIIEPKEQSPLDVVSDMATWDKYSMRGADDKSCHVFSLCRNNANEMNRRLWTAQVQVLFPLIEMERIKIIKLYLQELQSTITINNLRTL